MFANDRTNTPQLSCFFFSLFDFRCNKVYSVVIYNVKRGITMKFLSHRGYWNYDYEKNTAIAFERSFSLGFGTETDLRDLNGEVVISHDMPSVGVLTFSEMLEIYCKYDKPLPLALNIKSDGLQKKVKSKLLEYGVENYFLFDMSIPDHLVSLKHGLKCFTVIVNMKTTLCMKIQSVFG